MTVVEHPPMPKGTGFDLMVRGADPGYFKAIQIPFLSGRTFNADERLTRDHVVVINQTAARRLFPGESPIGRHLKVSLTSDIYQIVGVVGDTRWQISEPVSPTAYLPIYGNGYSEATVVI